MPNNNIVRSLWIGSTLSKIELLCINSFLQNGHDFYLYIYDEIKNIPEGVKIRDANQIIPKNEIFLDSSDSWAAFSDWFRYKLLYTHGGWWTDLDVICLKFLDFKTSYRFASELYYKDNEPHPLVTTSLIKSPTNAEYLFEILDYIENETHSNVNWGEYGPKLFDLILKKYNCTPYIEPPEVFCPINWDKINLFFLKDPPTISCRSYTIHLWNEMWTRLKINKNTTFEPSSLLEVYKNKFNSY
ncbi:glycosyltransferase [Sphingobacterium sp. HMA12]|uniref:glycosyltransferase n=1 Tax=Sphingobacterium sp. HMA12 TaxID=2050894 RepID=UPI000CEA3D72|nr:glycosyltransferase [Sphingobacterium sp. HMA12]